MKRWLCVLACVWLAGCTGVQVEDYADQQPRLDLQQFFDGPVEAWGMFHNRSARSSSASMCRSTAAVTASG